MLVQAGPPKLICCRSETDSKAVVTVELAGCDVVYQPRTKLDGGGGRIGGHELRISRPGSETHWLYADDKETAQEWQRVRMTKGRTEEQRGRRTNDFRSDGTVWHNERLTSGRVIELTG